jgi:quinohemoprotein ethanol dehydrogenase
MRRIAALLLAMLAVGCARHPAAPMQPTATLGRIDASRIERVASEPGQWLTSGRDGGQTYYSPLTAINSTNVGRLGFAWEHALGTSRGLEASPVVVDGVMFAVGNFGRVYALNARTGEERWTFIPDLDMQWARYACCDAVSRGLAVWKGHVYVAALDGYLYALDAGTGKTLWRVDTLLGRAAHVPYTVTGAPVIAGNVVVIGPAGGDYPGVRGYVSAYDLEAGTLRWRFFTVPRNPALGAQDQPHLVEAIKTWDAHHRWEMGGGGAVWDGLSYDPKTDLVYLGTGNVSPYNTREGGRKGGHELYTCSVVAVHASDGTLAWYYQEVPDDRWDFDSDQKFVLATIPWGGRSRDVLFHAAKNGFFYVLDRATGEFLSGSNFAFVNWTRGLDPKTHEPIPDPAADYTAGPALVWPSAFGAHSWQPMSFDPETGLVYIPGIDMPNVMVDVSDRPAKAVDGWFTVQGIMPGDYDPASTKSLYGTLPSLIELRRKSPLGPITPKGELIAWDPVAGKAAWHVDGASIWDGGVISTAGGLVFRGDSRGVLNVYDARNGQRLREIDIGTSILAAPITYSVEGEQYVAFMAGYGGGGGFAFPPDSAAYKYGNAGRIVALKLGGGPVPHPNLVTDPPFQKPTVARAPADRVAAGELLYNRVCSRCHVFGRGLLPDLRRFAPPDEALFYEIVLNGAYLPKGMGRFDDTLTRDDVTAIRAYIIGQAWDAYEGKAPAAMKSY